MEKTYAKKIQKVIANAKSIVCANGCCFHCSSFNTYPGFNDSF